MAVPFTPLEYQLYGRQMLLPELGSSGQQKLKNSRVLVVGAGGLGAPALLYLAGAGVGHITVVDDDLVELSNLHRQVIHTVASVGNSKAESAGAAMRALNPTVTVHTVRERLTDLNAEKLLAGVDAVLDGSDNFATRHLVSAACARAGIAHIWGAILGFDAQMSVFWAGRGPVYEDLYPQQPLEGSVPTCATAGVIGAMAGVVGTSMAMEAIKVVSGIGRPLIGELAYYSALEGRWEYIPLRLAGQTGAGAVPQETETEKPTSEESCHRDRGASTVDCTFADVQQMGDRVLLLDVRERAEFTALAIPGAVNLPLSELERAMEADNCEQLVELIDRSDGRLLAVYCSGGARSGRAAEILSDTGWGTVYCLTDGISGWLGTILD